MININFLIGHFDGVQHWFSNKCLKTIADYQRKLKYNHIVNLIAFNLYYIHFGHNITNEL